MGICANISERTIKELKSLGITEAALNQFFTVMGREKTPPEQLDHEVRHIAKNYLDLKAKLATFSSEDPEVTALTQLARQAVEAVNFPLAERLFNEASQRDEQAAQHLQQVATVRLSSAAATKAANGDLQRVQLNFEKAPAYYRKALELLPSSDKEHRSPYLMSLGNSLQEAGVRTSGVDIQKFLGRRGLSRRPHGLHKRVAPARLGHDPEQSRQRAAGPRYAHRGRGRDAAPRRSRGRLSRGLDGPYEKACAPGARRARR